MARISKKPTRYKPSAKLQKSSSPRPRASAPRYKPIKRHPIKQATPYSSVYTPRPGANPIKNAKPPKKAPYKRLFFLRPPAPVPKAPFHHKHKKEHNIDGVVVLLVILALIIAGVAGWIVASLI